MTDGEKLKPKHLMLQHLDKRSMLLSFLLPFNVIILALLFSGFAPFGKVSLMSMDAYSQYFPMLSDLRRGISTWSFSGALGFNQLAQSAYYTNSPLWAFLFLVPESFLISAIDLIVALRVGLSGLTFFIWMKERFKASDRTALPFSTAYALSGFCLAFLNQFMWYDAVVLLPLVALGLYRLDRGGKPWLYLIALSITLFSNFYIAYMVCLFSLLYAIYLTIKTKKAWRTHITFWTQFAAASLLAAGIMAFVLLPTYLALKRTIASDIAFNGELKLYHSFFDMLLPLLPFRKISLEYGPPNLYSGLTVFLLSLLTFIRKDKTLRQKGLFAGFLIFSYFSLNLNLLDFVWHGFHFPNQLPGRQSFLFTFVLISVAYPAMRYMTHTITTRSTVDAKKYRTLILVVLSIEIIGTAFFNIGLYTWRSDVTNYRALEKDMQKITGTYNQDEDFHRMEFTEETHNLGLRYGFHGIGYYSSTMSARAYDFFGNLGMDRYALNVSRNYKSTPIGNAIFGVRYLLHVEKDEAEENQEEMTQHTALAPLDLRQVDVQGNITVYENPHALPLAFAVDPKVLTFEMDEEKDQNFVRIWQHMQGHDAETDILFSDAVNHFKSRGLRISSIKKTDIKGTIYTDEDAILYASIANDGGWHILIDDEPTESLMLFDYCLGARLPKGEHTIRFTYTPPGLNQGIILSVISLLIVCAWFSIDHVKRSQKIARKEPTLVEKR